MQSACAALYWHLWPVRTYKTFPHYLINGTIFEKNVLNIKCVFWFSLQLLSEAFHIRRRIYWLIIIKVRRPSCKMSDFNETKTSNNIQISNFMKICPVGAELLHADGQRHITKPIVGFRKFVNASRNCFVYCHIGILSPLPGIREKGNLTTVVSVK
jgi:hypothetical protein